MKLKTIVISLLCIYCIFTVPMATLANVSFKIELPSYKKIDLDFLEKTNSVSLREMMKSAPNNLKFAVGECKKEIELSRVSNNFLLTVNGSPESKKEMTQNELEKVKVQLISTEKLENNQGEKIVSKLNFSEIPNAKHQEVLTESLLQDTESGGKIINTKTYSVDKKLLKESKINLSGDEVKKIITKSEDKGKSTDSSVGRNAILIEVLIVMVIIEIGILIIAGIGASAACNNGCWNACAGHCASLGRYFGGGTGQLAGYFDWTCVCTCSCGALYGTGTGPTPNPNPTPIVITP